MNGRMLFNLKKEDGILIGNNWKINVQNLAAGVYIVKLKAIQQENILKVVKL